MTRLVAAAAFVTAVWGTSAPCWAQPESFSGPPLVPLVVQAPELAEKEAAQSGDAVFRQFLRPVAGVRSQEAFKVAHKPEGYRRGYEITVPAGTLFFLTSLAGKELFCTAQSFENSFWDVIEAGVCLRDANSDGVAEGHVTLARKGRRIRHIFEFTGMVRNAAVEPIPVRYAKLPTEDLPQIKLEGTVSRSGLLDGRTWRISLRAYIPANVSTEVDEQYPWSYVDWPRGAADMIERHTVSVPAKPDKAGNSSFHWAPFAFTLKPEGQDAITVRQTAGLPAGFAIVAGTGEVVGSNYVKTTSTLQFVAIPQLSAAFQIVELQ
ncbi:MAG TPA: hypothetical protein VJ798_06805 [Rhizomicrobium sp.]|nr:hypothetical protein [Rhizomicrobium sp.]